MVVGRSAVVGRPVASLLLGADATVEVCHRRTRNLARETRRAEILVVAAGQPGLIRSEMVNRSAVVIDCGINTTPDGLVGDVDFAALRPVVSAITPVPGGVGPVTTMMLLQQTVEAAERSQRRTSRRWTVRDFRTVSESPRRPLGAVQLTSMTVASYISSTGTEPSMKPRRCIVVVAHLPDILRDLAR